MVGPERYVFWRGEALPFLLWEGASGERSRGDLSTG